MELKTKKRLLAMLVGSFVSGGVLAADTQGEGASSKGAEATGYFLEEIVVSARKRTESLQDVPVSVSAISGDELSNIGIEGVSDLYGRVPGLYFSKVGAVGGPTSDYSYLILRGVGFNGGQEPATGVFIDGMYQPQLGFDIGFLDLERLEVLRGPQGTLFGRNTQGGALSLVTRKPGEEVVGKVETEVDEFDTYRLYTSLSGPLTDNFFGGLSAEYGESDGYIDNRTTGENQDYYERYSVRGTLRWLPTEDLELILTADISQKDYNEMGTGAPLACDCYEVFADNQREDEKENQGVQFTLNWALNESIDLVSITGWRSTESDITVDLDNVETGQTPFTFTNGLPGSTVASGPVTVAGSVHRNIIKQEFFSQELRLTGGGDDLDWLSGLYYFDQSQPAERFFDVGPDVTTDPVLSFIPPAFVREDLEMDRDGWAVFGQVSWSPLEAVELTLGGRYTEETVETGGEGGFHILAFAPVLFAPDNKDTYSNFSPMASVSYSFDDDVMAYFTVAQGWKAGGFNRVPPDQAAADLSFDSEESTNWELGLKGTWFDRRLVSNLAVFYVDISEQQLLTTTANSAGVPVRSLANAGESRSQGIEWELNALVSDAFRISSAIAYTDAEFKDFTQIGAGGATVVRDGEEFEYVPDLTGSVTFEYNLPLQNGSELDFYLNYRYVAGYTVPEVHTLSPLAATLDNPSYERVDFRLSWLIDDWKIAGYVNNVLDSYDYTNIAYAGFDSRTDDNLYVQPLAPRQYGLVVTRTF